MTRIFSGSTGASGPRRSGNGRAAYPAGSAGAGTGVAGGGAGAPAAGGDRYKWIALSNTTLGVLMAVLNSSIVLIALPDIFRGIRVNPLSPANTGYLLWMLMGFMVAMAVLVVSLGRLGDMFGRVRMFNLGFAVFTAFSILLSVCWLHGSAGALYLIIMRVGQGVGGALLMANSSAILTDAFPPDQRGLAMGINNVALIAGSFIGLILGGLLAPVEWRLVFLVSVPFGIAGTLWAYFMLEERGMRSRARIDWAGNIVFALGLVLLMIGITYGIEPHGTSAMGWTGPYVLGELSAGVALLVAFVFVERRVAMPMFRLPLFRIRAFTAGVLSSFLSAVARGGLMFMLIIWLQGIWLPQHGYSFTQTPLWAGIYMLPLTGGFLLAGPISGILSDRFGSRPFATGGMVLSAVAFGLLELLPIDFSYLGFAGILLMLGLAMGAFASPNRAGVMNSLPPEHRGVGAGMNGTFQNSAQVLSIGIFFTLIITGLSSSLPGHLLRGLTHQGVPTKVAASIAHLPPVSILFAAFLGYNPMKHLLPAKVLASLPPSHSAALVGRGFFSQLISPPFASGLHEAFDFAVVACLVAAAASWSRGKRYVHHAEPAAATASTSHADEPAAAGEAASAGEPEAPGPTTTDLTADEATTTAVATPAS